MFTPLTQGNKSGFKTELVGMPKIRTFPKKFTGGRTRQESGTVRTKAPERETGQNGMALSHFRECAVSDCPPPGGLREEIPRSAPVE